MATYVIDYTFNATSVTNPDGTAPIDFPSATLLPSRGPGPILSANYTDAIDLGGASSFVTLDNIDSLSAWDRFRIRIVFQFAAVFDGDQVLFSLRGGPFLTLRLVGKGGLVHLTGDADDASFISWATPTENTPKLTPGSWFVADLVYDNDTLFVLLNEEVIGVHGFGEVARLHRDPGRPLEVGIGGGVLSGGDNFNGMLAAFQLEVGGIQPLLETLVDDARLTAEWYITTKVASLHLGGGISPSSSVEFDHHTFAWSQLYGERMIMYHSNTSSAYTMFGEILKFYQYDMTDDGRNFLGHLMSDQVSDPGTNETVTFSHGVIYKPATGPIVLIWGQIYLDYESSGGRAKWGLPTAQAQIIHGGKSQAMQNATFFLRNEMSSAHAVQGDILAKYSPKWGFPVVDEKDVFIHAATSGFDKVSVFESSTVYSNPGLGTHAVLDPIRNFYDSIGGPTTLGLPKADEIPVGAPSTVKVQPFDRGMIWTDGAGKMVNILPFSLILQQVDTTAQGASDNKLYAKFNVQYVTGNTGAKQTIQVGKYPQNSNNWGSRNSVPGINTAVSPEIVIKDVSDSIVLWMEILDDDTIDQPDNLGEWELILDSSNGWGYYGPTLILNSGRKPGYVVNISVELRPTSSLSIPSEINKFWSLPNAATQPLIEADYYHTFSDIYDSGSINPLKTVRAAFYDHAVRDMAVTGNCFGMCLEAISARKFISSFDFILSQYTNPTNAQEAWNSKQQYQAGAAVWWWWADQVISPGLLNPTSVFSRSQKEFSHGSHPVLIFYDTQLPDSNAHCVLPVEWRSSAFNLEILVIDPIQDVVPSLQSFNIDRTTQEFTYRNWDSTQGARVHYIPWRLVNRQPRTGVWEQMLCYVDGTVIAMGEDATTESIQDKGGFDISTTGHRATLSLNAGRRLDGHFAKLPVYMSGSFPGEILLSRGIAPVAKGDLAGLPPGADPIDLPLQIVDATEPLFSLPRLEGLLPTRPGDFNHIVSGTKEAGGGKLRYFVKSNLCHMSLDCGISLKEQITIRGQAIGTANAEYIIETDRPKLMNVQIVHRIGLKEIGHKDDFVSMALEMQWRQSGSLRIAIKPGLVRVELFPSNLQLLDQADVEVVSVLGGLERRRDLTLSDGFADGVRFKINPSLLKDEIVVATLDAAGQVARSEAIF